MKRQRLREEMDQCYGRVHQMKRFFVEAAIERLVAKYPNMRGVIDFGDTRQPSDDGKRLCIQICKLLDAEAHLGEVDDWRRESDEFYH